MKALEFKLKVPVKDFESGCWKALFLDEGIGLKTQESLETQWSSIDQSVCLFLGEKVVLNCCQRNSPCPLHPIK